MDIFIFSSLVILYSFYITDFGIKCLCSAIEKYRNESLKVFNLEQAV